jgi:hypothetical protein
MAKCRRRLVVALEINQSTQLDGYVAVSVEISSHFRLAAGSPMALHRRCRSKLFLYMRMDQ